MILSIFTCLILLSVVFLNVISDINAEDIFILKDYDVVCSYSDGKKNKAEKFLMCTHNYKRSYEICEMVASISGGLFKAEALLWTCPTDSEWFIIACKVRKSRFRRFFGGAKFRISCEKKFYENRSPGSNNGSQFIFTLVTGPLVEEVKSPCEDGYSIDHNGQCQIEYDDGLVLE